MTDGITQSGSRRSTRRSSSPTMAAEAGVGRFTLSGGLRAQIKISIIRLGAR